MAGPNFSKVGANLRLSINMPAEALTKLPIADIVRSHRPQLDNWPSLLIDVTEEQIITNLALAADIAKRLGHLNIKLAIDDFGRGHSTLTNLKELPIAELKLDQAFVQDCGTDRVNEPLCKTVIDLVHNFSVPALAIGIEKAADALALTSMGCDYGLGFLLGQPIPEARFLSLLRQRAAAHQSSAPPPAKRRAARPERDTVIANRSPYL
jgi:EAL domain-containing protein (putative c-di-GMP-specific phosphodiesterase class I)